MAYKRIEDIKQAIGEDKFFSGDTGYITMP